MSTTFTTHTTFHPGSPELEFEWYLGTVSFAGGAFNPFPDGGWGTVPIGHFILNMEHILAEFEELGDQLNAAKAMSFWHIAKGASLQGARAVSWA
jgi:hypothetical protein